MASPYQSTFVTNNTSVILVPTSLQSTIVFLSTVANAGQFITVRDNDGLAGGSNLLISTTSGVSFVNNPLTPGNLLAINQPFGFVTFSSQSSNRYAVLNTFAFPSGSASATVSNLTTTNTYASTLTFKDIAGSPYSGSNNLLYVSAGILYLNTKDIAATGPTGPPETFTTASLSSLSTYALSLQTNLRLIVPEANCLASLPSGNVDNDWIYVEQISYNASSADSALYEGPTLTLGPVAGSAQLLFVWDLGRSRWMSAVYPATTISNI